MRMIEAATFGGPEVLAVVERPQPVPGPGQVLVAVRSATVNPVDLFTRSGAAADFYPVPAQLVGAVHEFVPNGVDAVLDAAPVGPALIGAARDGGSFTTVVDPAVPASERGVRVAKVSVAPDAAALRELVDALATGRLRTRVAGTVPFADVAQAHRRAEAGGFRGKLVLVP